MSERRRPPSLSEELRALRQTSAAQTQEITALRREVAELRQANASLRQTLVNLASTVAARIAQALTPVTELHAALAAPQQSAQALSSELFELRRLLTQLAPRLERDMEPLVPSWIGVSQREWIAGAVGMGVGTIALLGLVDLLLGWMS